MKRIALFILHALIVIFIFTGCTPREKILPNQLYETFQSGDFTANNWVRGGASLPMMQSETVQKGRYAVEFPGVETNQTSFMYIDLDIEEDMVISFYVKTHFVSGNANLNFCIDGRLTGCWWGLNDWKQVIRELPAGKHRLTWELSMDRDAQSEETNAWLDNIMISEFILLGEPIVFNDEILKADVLDLIGKGTANSDSRYSDEEVYANEVKDAERFQVHHDVTDITGLEYFTGLKYIAVTAADVSDISPMSNLQHLEIVIFYGIPITDITALNASGQSGRLKALTLQGLSLSQTALEPIKTWAGIERLDLEGMPLVSLDFLPSGSSLWQLVLNDTGVTDISALSNQSGLKTLLLNNNEIEDISPLSNLTKMKTLSLRNNRITDLTPLENLLNLSSLRISDNEIGDLDPLSNLTNLRLLFMNNNHINTLDSIAGFEQLEYLDADNTGLEDITAIEYMKQLKRLSLNSNAITEIIAIVQGPVNTLEYLSIKNNYLDLTEGSEDMENIQLLIDREVEVDYKPQREGNPSKF